MHKFFDPGGIVVIGVSEAPRNLGQRVVDNLVRCQYRGKIVAVGRREGVVCGVPILSGMDRPEPFEGCELAVVLSPARTTPAVVRRCGELGIDHVVVETSGYAELEGERSQVEADLVAAIRDAGVRLIGPNCLGVIQMENGNLASFAGVSNTVGGDAAILSQSGGVALTFMRALNAQGVGVGWMVSVGNKLDVDETELLAYLLANKPVSRVLCYLESMATGRGFCDAARNSDVPIIVQKVNRTDAAERVAGSHTAALANDDAVLSAALEQAGIVRARDSHDVELAFHASRLAPLRSQRIALLSRSGGHAVIATDACADEGLELPPFSDELLAELAQIQPEGVILRGNPLDFGDVFDFDKMERIVERVAAAPQFDGVALVIVFNELREIEGARRLIETSARLSRSLEKPISIAVVTQHQELLALRQRLAWPLFATPEDAVRALGLQLRRFAARERARAAPVAPQLDAAAAEQLETLANASSAKVWSLERSLALVELAGIPVAPHSRSELEPGRPFPVVAKHSADSAEVVHKARLGLVHAGLNDAEAVARAAVAIKRNAEQHGLEAGQVLVQPHLDGPEVFLGARQDPSFGPMVLFGCGGSLVELIDDVALWPYPFTLAEIEHRLGQTRLPQLAGDKLDPAALAGWLAGLGELLVRLPQIAEIDVNPVVLSDAGPAAVDARVVSLSA